MLYGEGDENKLGIREDAGGGHGLRHHPSAATALPRCLRFGLRDRLPPSGHMDTCRMILNTLASVKPRDKNAMGPLLHDIANQVRRRGLFFLISDCFDDVDSIPGRACSTTLLAATRWSSSRAASHELDFPFKGMVQVRRDGREDAPVDQPQLVRPTICERSRNTWKSCKTGCERNRCELRAHEHRQAARGTLTRVSGATVEDARRVKNCRLQISNCRLNSNLQSAICNPAFEI